MQYRPGGFMRVRIVRQPPANVDGISLERFRLGLVCEVGTQLGSLLVAEGWAEFADVETDRAPSASPPSALVLVVDDDTDLRHLTSALLSVNGYGVVEASHGREAMQRLALDTPDVIVLDLNMPVMDGWQFCAEQRRLRDARLAAVPVVLLTAAESAATHAASLNAAGLVTKPFAPDHLLGAVKTALTR
jgi:CheY-like chemotaxis protein